MSLIDYILESYPNTTLTSKQIALAEDIDAHRTTFQNGFLTNNISVLIDQLSYSNNVSTKMYHAIKGLSLILIVSSIICLFLSWKISVVILLFAVVSRSYANIILRKGGNKVRNTIKQHFFNGETNKALMLIWYLFGSGKIALQTINGKSITPQLPSECF